MTQQLLSIVKNAGNTESAQQAAILVCLLAATMYSVSATRKNEGLSRWLFKQALRFKSTR